MDPEPCEGSDWSLKRPVQWIFQAADRRLVTAESCQLARPIPYKPFLDNCLR
jgi:hypothetical protein